MIEKTALIKEFLLQNFDTETLKLKTDYESFSSLEKDKIFNGISEGWVLTDLQKSKICKALGQIKRDLQNKSILTIEEVRVMLNRANFVASPNKSMSKGFGSLEDALEYSSKVVAKDVEENVLIYQAIKEVKAELPPVIINDINLSLEGPKA